MEGAGILAATGSGPPAATSAATSTVAIGVTVIATLVVAALLVAALYLVRNARALRRAADELRRESRDLMADLGGTVARAGADLDRVDDLIGSAERLTDTVGSASHLAYAAVASPVIKVMAIGAGTARASERIRRRRKRR